MSFADELSGNIKTPVEKYYFKDISTIMSRILASAKSESYRSRNLSGYYSYADSYSGEPEGISKNQGIMEYFHVEDFGVYREGILAKREEKLAKGEYIFDDPIVTRNNAARALTEIKRQLVAEGFKNVVVEERQAFTRKLVYGDEKMSFFERHDFRRPLESRSYPRGATKQVSVEMPTYALFISISW